MTAFAQTCILPPEWAQQSGVLLTWPHAHGDWGQWLDEVETVFVTLAREIARRETVLILCFDDDHCRHVRALLDGASLDPDSVQLVPIPSDDAWARDHGPISVLCDGAPHLLDFTFNGWGGKYPATRDNDINRRLHATGLFGPIPRHAIELELEGGAIDTDGQGTVLTTESCLLHGHRKPGLDRQTLEQQLKRLLGAERFLWLRHGHLLGDDTDGHIDTLARFCNPSTIAFSQCNNPDDEHYEPLQAMEAQLRELRDRNGRAYRLLPLHLPRPILDEQGMRLPATYANFLIINTAVLVPVYDDPADEQAVATLQNAFPDRQIVTIDCRPLIRQHGSLHCVTMQLPHGVLC